MAGDLVEGRWGRDDARTGVFGPVRTPSQRLRAWRRAADVYYPAWRERFDQIPFFSSLHFGLDVDYIGHAEGWDAIEVSGDLAAKDAHVIYRDKGRVAALATVLAMGSAAAVARQRQNLQAELAMERGGDVAAVAR